MNDLTSGEHGEHNEDEISQIRAQVEEAARQHLQATDADTALGHFTKDIYAVTNNRLFASFDALAEDVRAFYNILKHVNHAKWDDMHFVVISSKSVLFTAKFRYSFTDTADKRYDLEGIWTALFVNTDDHWNIRVRHESFTESNDH